MNFFSHFSSLALNSSGQKETHIFFKIEQSEAGTDGYVISAWILETSERGLFLVSNGFL